MISGANQIISFIDELNIRELRSANNSFLRSVILENEKYKFIKFITLTYVSVAIYKYRIIVYSKRKIGSNKFCMVNIKFLIFNIQSRTACAQPRKTK